VQTQRGEQLHGIEEKSEEGQEACPQGGAEDGEENRPQGCEDIGEEGQAGGEEGACEEGPGPEEESGGAQKEGCARAGHAAGYAERSALRKLVTGPSRPGAAGRPLRNEGRARPLPPSADPNG
jgi:hypothetical protein